MKRPVYALVFILLVILALLYIRFTDRIMYEVIIGFVNALCISGILSAILLFFYDKIFHD